MATHQHLGFFPKAASTKLEDGDAPHATSLSEDFQHHGQCS